MLWSLMHCYIVIETYPIVDYSITVLKYIIISASLKIWAWLQMGHTQIVGVVATRAPLVKIFSNQHWPGVSHWKMRIAKHSTCEITSLLIRH